MCIFCENIFDKQKDADFCEKGHVDLVNLEITKVSYCMESGDTLYGYPDFIMLENNTKSGSAALYEIVREGSVEDIYTEM